MTAGLETPIAAGAGPSIFGIAKAIGTKIRDSAEQAKEEKEKANKEGVEVKKGSLFTKSLKNNFNPIKSKKAKTKWAKDFSWNQPKPKDPTAQSQGGGGGGSGKGGKSGAAKLKNFITSAFGLLLKDTTVMIGKLSNISDLTGKVYSANKQSYGTLTSINQLLQEQTDIRRDMLEQAKYARMEKSLEKTSDASGTSKPIGVGKPGGQDGEGGGGDGGGDAGGGGLLGGFGGALDFADNLLDIGSHLKKTRFARKMRVAGKKGVRAASRLGKNAKGFASKFLGKAVGNEGVKIGAKAATKAGGKAVAKGIGKAVLKKIPLVGLVAGVGFGIERMMRGDWGGGLTEIASGAASTVPGFGTAASVALDAGLMAKDMSDPASMMPQEKLAEGGVIPTGVYDNPTTGVLPPGSSVIPLNRNAGKQALGQENTDEMLATPMKAVGAAILGISDRMLKQTDSGIAGDMVRQDISRLSREFGISNPLTTTSLGRASFTKKAFSKESEKYFAEVMKKSFANMGVDLTGKDTKPTPSGSGGGGGGGGGSTDSTETETPSVTPSSSGAAPATPGQRQMTADEYAAKITKEVTGEVVGTQNLRGGGSRNVYGLTDKRLSRVKNSETGTESEYYHDTLGQLYKMSPYDGKLTRVAQSEIEAGSGDWITGKWDFFRKPDRNVVLGRLQSMPVGSVKLANRQIVYEAQDSQRSAKVKRLREPTQDERNKYGIDQIKTPYGSAASEIPQIQAASGVSVISRLGDSGKLAAAPEGECVTGVLRTMEKNGVPNPAGTGSDPNNPRGLAAQLIKSYGWGSIPGLGQKINLKSPYGNVGANAMSFGEWKEAVKGNKIPSGAVVFTTRNRDWSGNRSSGHDAAIAKQGGRKLWSGHWQAQVDGVGAVYGTASNKIIALTPGGQQIPYDGSTSGDDGGDSTGTEDAGSYSNMATAEDIDSIFGKIKEYAAAMNPNSAAQTLPTPGAPSSSASATRPAGGGMGGARGGSAPAGKPSTTFVPVAPKPQSLSNTGSVPGSVTPYAASPVAVASTPYAVNPFLFID